MTLLDLMEPEQSQARRERAPFQVESQSRYNHYHGGVYSVTRLVYATCSACGGKLDARDYCEECVLLAYQWARERQLLRGFLRFQPYKYMLKIDKTKSLKKSCGKYFYHEVNFSRDFEAHDVSIVMYWVNPETGRYEVFPGSGTGQRYEQTHWFKNMEEATAWLGHFVSDNLRYWWK